MGNEVEDGGEGFWSWVVLGLFFSHVFFVGLVLSYIGKKRCPEKYDSDGCCDFHDVNSGFVSLALLE